MSIGSTGSRGKIFCEINITPLTDIFLVLLIIMMIIAPMFNNSGQNIERPEIRTGDPVSQTQITVEITKEGKFFVNGKSQPLESLTNILQEAAKTTGAKKVVLVADKLTQSRYVMSVMRSAQAAGLEKLVVSGQPLTSERSNVLSQPTKDDEIEDHAR